MTDLVGLHEIADRLGVPYRRTILWRRRRRLPPPKIVVGRSPAWEWADIEEWARKTGRWTAE